jgi:uncharacterized membrane protein (GlpM family)
MGLLLLLKLTVTPAAIGLATLVGRRYGPSIAGWIAGFPFTSGPLTLFLALERGAPFATAAAIGVLGGTASQAAFALAYAWAAIRWGWFVALAAASVAFAASTFGLNALRLTEIPALEIAAGSIVLALALMPPQKADQRVSTAPAIPPAVDLVARMVIATAMVVLLTGIAPVVGATLAGLLSPFPVFAAVLIVFPHRGHGSAAAVAACRGFLWGLFAFGGFAVMLASLLPVVPLGIAFVSAIAVTGVIQAVTLLVLRRLSRRQAAPDEQPVISTRE